MKTINNVLITIIMTLIICESTYGYQFRYELNYQPKPEDKGYAISAEKYLTEIEKEDAEFTKLYKQLQKDMKSMSRDSIEEMISTEYPGSKVNARDEKGYIKYKGATYYYGDSLFGVKKVYEQDGLTIWRSVDIYQSHSNSYIYIKNMAGDILEIKFNKLVLKDNSKYPMPPLEWKIQTGCDFTESYDMNWQGNRLGSINVLKKYANPLKIQGINLDDSIQIELLFDKYLQALSIQSPEKINVIEEFKALARNPVSFIKFLEKLDIAGECRKLGNPKISWKYIRTFGEPEARGYGKQYYGNGVWVRIENKEDVIDSNCFQ